MNRINKVEHIAILSAVLFYGYMGAMFFLHRGSLWDFNVSSLFFKSPCLTEAVRSCWLIDKENKTLTFWLHDLPVDVFKGVAIVWAGILLAGCFRTEMKQYRYAALIMLLGIAVFPVVISLLKGFTGHYCPAQLAFYGGPVGAQLTNMKPRCFPAGFPSPGFGLIILYFSSLPLIWRRIALFAGLGLGSAMSIIQLARGEHFLTHNIATLLTAVFIGCLLALVEKYIVVRRIANTDS